MAITKIDAASETFDGFARVVIFPDVDPNEFTLETTLDEVLTGGIDLGQIVEDSPSWDGEDSSVDVLRDTEGGVIRALPTAGTFAYSLRLASTSAKMSAAIAGAKLKETTEEEIGDIKTPNGKSIIKLTPSDMTKKCPVAVFNKTKNRLMLFPKASVSATPTFEDNMFEYKLSVTAEDVSTKELATMMFVPLAENPLDVTEDETAGGEDNE